jgi:RTX calcium-binding nonapeptide repeat (4 copies)/Cysteine-rich secretory protein family
MAQVAATAYEQYFLELINRARLNPAAEAEIQGITLNQGIAANTLDASQRQVLAINPFLNQAADGHSTWMRANNVFSHTGSGGSDGKTRMVAEGYAFTGSWSWGENLAWTGSSGTLDVTAAVTLLHHNLFVSTSGHRQNLLNNTFREAGVGLSSVGAFTQGGATYANSLLATHNFALSGSNLFVTGVTYTDSDANNFYSVGEGIGSRTVQLYQNGIAALNMASTAAGGYSVSTSGSGTIEARFSGGGLTTEMGASFSMGGQNVKIDLVNGNTILSSMSATLTGAALNLTLLGINANAATGNALDNTLTGNSGSNVLSGGDGNDVMRGLGGADHAFGGNGQDTLYVTNNAAGDSITFDGGADRDAVSFVGVTNGGIWLDLGYNQFGAGIGQNNLYLGANTGNILNVESVTGTASDDVIRGDSNSNNIIGGMGNDTLLSYSPYDTVNPYASLGDVIEGREGNDLLYSGSGNDYLDGGAGDDIIEVGGGTDTVVAGIGNDTILFSPRTGTDTVLDFEGGQGTAAGHGDVIKLYNFGAAFDTFAEVMAVATQVGADTQIALTDTTIILQNFSRATLVADDFLFA